MTTPQTTAPEWEAQQAQPWTPHNEAIRLLDAFAVKSAIEDRDLTSPPVSCSDGARYLVDTPATGLWAGKDGQLAIAQGASASNGWRFATVAREGNQLYVRDEEKLIEYLNGAWRDAPGRIRFLGDLDDVDLTGLNDFDLIRWDASNGQWVPSAVSLTINELTDIGDVDPDGALFDGAILQWDLSNSAWVPITLPEPGEGVDRLVELEDVDTSTLADGLVLKYDASNGVFYFAEDRGGGGTDLYLGEFDAQLSPNYPAMTAGQFYSIGINGGEIGGSDGTSVAFGDLLFCINTSAGGTEEAVSTDYAVIARNAVHRAGTIAGAGNPNYPRARGGQYLKVISDGKVGGAAGKDVTTDDLVLCTETNDGGSEAAVGSNWVVIPTGSVGSGSGVDRLVELTDVDITGLADGNVLKWDASNGNFYFAEDLTGTGISRIRDASDVNFTSFTDNYVVTYDADTDKFILAAGNNRLQDLDDVDTTGLVDGNVLKWDGSNGFFYFAEDRSGIGAATKELIWQGDVDTHGVTPKSLFEAAAEQTLADGATITPDLDLGINFKVTLGGNRTLANPTNAKSGQSGLITVTQDGTGSRTLSYGSNWRFPGGSASGGVLSTGAGDVDVISYFVRADGTIIATMARDFAA